MADHDTSRRSPEINADDLNPKGLDAQAVAAPLTPEEHATALAIFGRAAYLAIVSQGNAGGPPNSNTQKH